MKQSWLLSTACGMGLLVGSVTAALAQNVPGENATAPSGTGAATQTIFLKPGQEAGTNTVLPADTAGNPNASSQDARFVLHASAGGKAEVMMGQLAIQRGQTQSERDYGQMLVSDHTQANQELSGMADTLMLRTASGPAPMQRAMYRQLEAAPADQFDAMFNQEMIAAHRQTIALFKTEARSGENPGLRKFALGTLPILYKHLHVAEALSPSATPTLGMTSMTGTGTAPQAALAVDAPVSGNPDQSADQLNARELTTANPS